MRSSFITALLIPAMFAAAHCSAPSACLTGDPACQAAILPLLYARSAQARYLFAANQSGNNLNAYRVSPFSGQITALGSIAVGTYPTFASLSPDNRFLYVSNQNSNDVTQLLFDSSSGALTANGSLAIAGGAPQVLLVSSGGQTAYAANYTVNNLWTLSLNSITGTLSQTGTVAAGTSPQGMVFDPQQNYLFVVNLNSNNVSCFSVGLTGGLSLLGTTSVGGGAGPCGGRG